MLNQHVKARTCFVRSSLALSTVLLSNMATVMGPTPPGTGVMYDARSLATLNSTSPTKRFPDFLVLSGIHQKNITLHQTSTFIP